MTQSDRRDKAFILARHSRGLRVHPGREAWQWAGMAAGTGTTNRKHRAMGHAVGI